MSAPQQLTLAIEHPHEQRLDNFVAGANAELVQTLKHGPPGFCGYWIYGELSSGRSHLLRGACLLAQSRGQTSAYIGCADYAHNIGGLASALAHAADFGDLVAVDDVGVAVGEPDLEESLMRLYQRLLQDDGCLLIAHSQAALGLDWQTADLGSRMRSLQHFQMQPLDDSQKMQLLRQRAQNRGYELSQAVLDYWLTRGPRDLGALLIDLDTLDKASLAHQQRVTIPLLKQVLGY